MTKLTKPVARESAAMDRGKPLIVTLHAGYLELRPKGTRQRYTIDYGSCLWLAVKRQRDAAIREALAKRKGRKR